MSSVIASSSRLTASSSRSRIGAIASNCCRRNISSSCTRHRGGAPHPPSSTGYTPPDTSSASSPSNPSLGPLRIIDPPSHLTSYFYPPDLRAHYLALQAFFIELQLIPSTVSSEILAKIRYGWWREAIASCFASKEVGQAGKKYKHPIIVELEKAILDPRVLRNGGLVKDHFDAIIDAHEHSIAAAEQHTPSLAQLEATSERIYSRQFYLHLNLVGVSSPPVDEIFSHLGKATGILETILDTPSRMGVKLNINPNAKEEPSRIVKSRKPSLTDGQRGLSLPSEYIQECHVVQEDILRNGGRAAGFKDVIFKTATRANDYLITARSVISKECPKGRIPHQATPVLVGTTRIPFLLQRLQKYDFDPFTPHFRFEAKGKGWRLPVSMYKTYWTQKI
ncbi:unnamed protein product [Sympodiomycopsis kandeliae]